MTLGLKISQGTLQRTLLCSEASSTLLNGVINNNKAIIFYFSFGVIALFLNFGSFRFNFFSSVKPFSSDLCYCNCTYKDLQNSTVHKTKHKVE